jgi:hypothetical protein
MPLSLILRSAGFVLKPGSGPAVCRVTNGRADHDGHRRRRAHRPGAFAAPDKLAELGLAVPPLFGANSTARGWIGAASASCPGHPAVAAVAAAPGIKRPEQWVDGRGAKRRPAASGAGRCQGVVDGKAAASIAVFDAVAAGRARSGGTLVAWRHAQPGAVAAPLGRRLSGATARHALLVDRQAVALSPPQRLAAPVGAWPGRRGVRGAVPDIPAPPGEASHFKRWTIISATLLHRIKKRIVHRFAPTTVSAAPL